MLALARRQTPPAAATASPIPIATPPALVLNGYDIVAASKLEAVSFYGPHSRWPGYPGLQGSQAFDVVDPSTGVPVGSFTAHVRQDPRSGTEVLQVTETHSGTVGVNAGNTPPVGSIISVSGQGTKVTKVYSDMPSANGYVARYDRTTPAGNTPLPVHYHAAFLHTDYAAVNRPLDLLNGFTIAPQTPNSAVFTTITGMPPTFTAVQGTQAFDIYDRNGVPVGSFAGMVTTTSDFSGINTKMIVVTATGPGADIGIGPGQVPPVGTVYNVISFAPNFSVLYQSSPTPAGDRVSTRLVTKTFSIPLRIGNLDASTPPQMSPVRLPGGASFVPGASGSTAGVNGLPPRDMITQGYQQFDVRDAHGTKVGGYDAYLTRGWTGLKYHTRETEILVVKVTDGTGAKDVPEVGTVYDIRMMGNTGFGHLDISTPNSGGGTVSKRYLVTPLGYLPLASKASSGAIADNVDFYDPFTPAS